MMTLKCSECGGMMMMLGSKIIGRTEQKQVLEDIVFTCTNPECLEQTVIKKYRKAEEKNGL